MYQQIIRNQEQAICHLLLHCCMKDGKLADRELDLVADRFVRLNIHKELNFKEETESYLSYAALIRDESAYVEYLAKVITPVNNLAIYSYCLELILEDELIEPEEDSLLRKIGEALGIEPHESDLVEKLLVQRKIVESEKIL